MTPEQIRRSKYWFKIQLRFRKRSSDIEGLPMIMTTYSHLRWLFWEEERYAIREARRSRE